MKDVDHPAWASGPAGDALNLLIVSQYFWPEEFRVNDLAKGLRDLGHKVTVLTGKPNYPLGSYFDGYGFWGKAHDEFDGIPVKRVPLVRRGRNSRIGLILNYLSFAAFGSVVGPRLCDAKFDAIIVFGPSPVTAVFPAIAIKRRVHAPILFWVLDLWPESLVATGIVRSPRLVKMVSCLVRYIYKWCDLILIQSTAFVSAISPLADAGKLRYFPSWAEDVFGHTDENVSADAAESFTVMFAGNIGVSQDFPSILSAAEILKDHTDIRWIIVGDGRLTEWTKAEVQTRNLSNVQFVGRHSLSSMPRFYAKADVMLVTLKRDAAFARTIPGKVQSYMAAGKPIVAMLDGEGARVIDEARAGLTCPAESPAELAAAVLRMARMSARERAKMGECAREYYVQNFDRDVLLDRLVSWIKALKDERSVPQKNARRLLVEN